MARLARVVIPGSFLAGALRRRGAGRGAFGHGHSLCGAQPGAGAPRGAGAGPALVERASPSEPARRQGHPPLPDTRALSAPRRSPRRRTATSSCSRGEGWPRASVAAWRRGLPHQARTPHARRPRARQAPTEAGGRRGRQPPASIKCRVTVNQLATCFGIGDDGAFFMAGVRP